LSEPDRTRPALPDPQRDRHVSFPDGPESVAPPAPSGPSLPPEAWAARSSGPGPVAAAPSSKRAQERPVVTTPPGSPVRLSPRRRVPGWIALLLLPPLLIGLSNHEAPTERYDCWSYDSGAGPDVEDCDGTTDGILDGTTDGSGEVPGSVKGVWVEPVHGSTGSAAVLTGTPQVRPVPADASLLRVEVVSTTGAVGAALEAQVDSTVAGFTMDSWYGPLPAAFEIHLDEHPSDLTVSVVVGSGTVQCRIYADELLVAVSTSSSVATCTPTL
jgi:hypothetical protein